MAEILNPYIAGNPISGSEMFFGRDDIFEFIKETLIGQHRDNVIVLHGQQRTGKTSVLLQIHRHINEGYINKRYLCIFVDLHSFIFRDLSSLLWGIAFSMAQGLRDKHRVDIPDPDHSTFIADPRRYFGEFLSQIHKTIGDQHILLMLDEAARLQEQVKKHQLEDGVFEYMRYLMQHYEWLNFLFSLGNSLQEMTEEYTFLFNVGLCKKISFLDRETTRALITQPIKKYYHLKPEALERIYQITSGHPYYTQLLCHSLFNSWKRHYLSYKGLLKYYKRQRISCINIRNINEVLDEVIERGEAVLKQVWEVSSKEEKAVLVAMITTMKEYNRPVGAKMIIEEWAKYDVIIPEDTLEKAIGDLIARDIITGKSEYTFTVDLQRLWLQKNKQIERVKIVEIPDVVKGWISQVQTVTIDDTDLVQKANALDLVNSTGTPQTTTNSSELWKQLLSRRKVIIGVVGLSLTAAGIFSLELFRTPSVPSIVLPPPALGTTLYTYTGHTEPVYTAPWSPNGKRIASSSQDLTVKVWDATSGNTFLTYREHLGTVYTAAWSPNGNFIVSGGDDRKVLVWDATSGKTLLTYKGHTDTVYAAVWSPNGRFIASGGKDRKVLVWDTTSGKTLLTYKGHTDTVYAIAWSPNYIDIVSGGASGTVEVWHASSGNRFLAYQGHPTLVTAVAWSPDGKYIATSGGDKIVKIWDASSGSLILSCKGHTNNVDSVAWSPDGKYIASGGNEKDSTVKIWNATSGHEIFTYRRHTGWVADVAWSPNSKLIASAGQDEKIRVWQASK